jgi:hypothetical protein
LTQRCLFLRLLWLRTLNRNDLARPCGAKPLFVQPDEIVGGPYAVNFMTKFLFGYQLFKLELKTDQWLKITNLSPAIETVVYPFPRPSDSEFAFSIKKTHSF